MPIHRLTLIVSIFAVGSYFLSVLSGTIGWFSTCLSSILTVSASCFFALVLYSLTAKFLLQQKKRDNRTEHSFRKTKPLVGFSIGILITAHVFVLTQNVSPGENLLGNHDQGMYLAAASHLYLQGSHSMETNWIRQSPAGFRRFFTKEISPSLKTESLRESTHLGTQAGFYLTDAIGSSQYIQFPPGYPTVLAALWSLGGYGLVAYSNVLICMLCGLMLAAVCCNYIDGFGTLSTWLLFIFCPLTIWSANHLYPEPLLLLLWRIALWALEFSEDYPWLSATLASLSIGAAFLVKIDAIPLFIVPLAYAFICKSGRLRFRATFLVLSIVAHILATGLYLYYSKPYFEFTLSGLLSGRLFFLTVCTVSSIAVALNIKQIRLKASGLVQANEQLFRYGLAISIGLILCYFYFVRPHTLEPHRVFSDESGNHIESLREKTFYRLGWYFTPLGLTLASAGLMAAFTRRMHSTQLAFTGIAMLFLLYYSYDIHCTPYQPYAMRRLFPFVVPALCFCIPFLIQNLPVKICSPKIKGLLILLITAILLPQFQQITQKLVIRKDYSGLYEYLSAISKKLPKDEIILVNGKGTAYLYVAPLRYLFEQECILVYPDYRAREYHAMIDHFIGSKNQIIHVLSAFPNDRMNLRAKIISTEKLADTLHTTYSGTATTDYPDNDTKPFQLSFYLTKLKIP